MKKIEPVVLKEDITLSQNVANNSTPRKAPPSESGSGSGDSTDRIFVSGAGTFTIPPTSLLIQPDLVWFLEGQVIWHATAFTDPSGNIIIGSLQLTTDSHADFCTTDSYIQRGADRIHCVGDEVNGVGLSVNNNTISSSASLTLSAYIEDTVLCHTTKEGRISFSLAKNPATDTLDVVWDSVHVTFN